MRHFAWLAVGLLAQVAPLAAQRGTAEQLRQAHTLYDQLELERAARVLRVLLSPQWAAPIQPAQRVEAFKLLGATLVLVGRVDSGVVSFRNAVQLDPFADLEPEEFTPAQVGAFARARRQVFAVATRPVAAGRVDPRMQRIRFPLATTHAAAVRAELRTRDSVVMVFESGVEGVAEIAWDGLVSHGRLAAPGRYELRVRAASRLMPRTDSASLYFELRAETPPLEDTLPTLAPTDLLPELTPPSAGAGELGKGLAIAGGVLVIAGPLANGALGHENAAKPAIVASAGILAGVIAFVAGRKRRDIPANITANRTRLTERRAANAAIGVRNAERIAATILVVTPAAGVGP